ncbi:MAG: hypothetical protein QXH27_01385 [Candidatus Micrarchaeia archaeon]
MKPRKTTANPRLSKNLNAQYAPVKSAPVALMKGAAAIGSSTASAMAAVRFQECSSTPSERFRYPLFRNLLYVDVVVADAVDYRRDVRVAAAEHTTS